MQGTFHAAALILLAALTLTASAAPQISAAPLRQQEPTGLLDPDGADEVARAIDEAERRIGRTIHVNVAVDKNGRRVSTGWMSYTPHEGAVYARETPMPMLVEDVDAPDGIVVLVDPFERTGSSVEAPGLSESDQRYLSRLITDHLRRGLYDDGLIAASYGLEDLFTHPGSLPVSTDRPYGSETGRVSSVAVAIFVGGSAVVLLLLGYLLKGERCRQPLGPERGIGFVVARRDAEAALSTIAPRVVLLAERETAVIDRLRNFDEGLHNGPERRHGAEALLRRAASGAFWENFVVASSRVEEDPEKALLELRRLAVDVEAALNGLREAERTLGDPWADEGPGGGEEDLTRRDRNDG